MANVVLVVDMVRGFLEEGYPLYCGNRARRIIPNVQGLLEQELTRGSSVFFLCDHHSPDDPEFKMFPPHCLEGTAEAEVIPELARYQGTAPSCPAPLTLAETTSDAYPDIIEFDKVTTATNREKMLMRLLPSRG